MDYTIAVVEPRGVQMESITERPRASTISAERRSQLEAKGELTLPEAAEYLMMSPKTLYNLMWEARKPGCSHKAPKALGGGGHGMRLRFAFAELKAWRKLNGR